MLRPPVRPCCLLGVVFATIPAVLAVNHRPLQTALPAKRPLFTVGDIVYVAASVLNIRSQPQAKGFETVYVVRNERGTILALPNRHWARVLFTSEDVGVEGYVSQWYLAKEKSKAGQQ